MHWKRKGRRLEFSASCFYNISVVRVWNCSSFRLLKSGQNRVGTLSLFLSLSDGEFFFCFCSFRFFSLINSFDESEEKKSLQKNTLKAKMAENPITNENIYNVDNFCTLQGKQMAVGISVIQSYGIMEGTCDWILNSCSDQGSDMVSHVSKSTQQKIEKPQFSVDTDCREKQTGSVSLLQPNGIVKEYCAISAVHFFGQNKRKNYRYFPSKRKQHLFQTMPIPKEKPSVTYKCTKERYEAFSSTIEKKLPHDVLHMRENQSFWKIRY